MLKGERGSKVGSENVSWGNIHKVQTGPREQLGMVRTHTC